MFEEYVYGRPWKFSRYNRGKTIPFQRTVYGYRISCPDCDFEQRVNNTKREARSVAASHYRYVHAKNRKADS